MGVGAAPRASRASRIDGDDSRFTLRRAEARVSSSPLTTAIHVEAQPAARRGTNGSTIAGPVRLNLLVSGTYAWAVTVAIPALAAGPVPIACALAALVALVGGVMLSYRFADLGRLLTMVGFLGLSCVTWFLMGDALNVASLEPVRSALGALGWMVFALGWGSVRQPGSVPEEHPRFVRDAEPLLPRRALPRATLPVFGLAVGCALAPWLAAWSVARREHGLLAHALGLAAAMWMMVSGSNIAVALGASRKFPRPRSRLASATAALAWACGLVAVGLLYWLTEVKP